MNTDLYREFLLQKEYVCGIVGRAAVSALQRAKARLWADDRGVEFMWEDECDFPWDGDGPAPNHWLCLVAVLHDAGKKYTECVGGVAVSSLDDPYLRTVEAELALEIFNEWEEDDRKRRIMNYEPPMGLAEGW